MLLPLVVAAIIAGLSMAGGSGRRARRYRPGRPHDFTPTWFLASPEQVRAQAAQGSRAHTPALESGVVGAGARAPMGATGGASDRW